VGASVGGGGAVGVGALLGGVVTVIGDALLGVATGELAAAVGPTTSDAVGVMMAVGVAAAPQAAATNALTAARVITENLTGRPLRSPPS